ncbi:hypothetical protein VaNZ11_001435 [Volvox africanus]|uniref:Uncharacterized protein n=1 Tax=Volvox africanus TaxID=51714 RepID=A0ABQ5RR16_9CHLO|nr:hypothetical protein VaNZ11_001435 [Volvox africanus]
MGAQQSSSAALVQGSEMSVNAQDALEDIASIKAHAIECLSVASSYQSLSELEDFLKPGELALTRWSRPNVVPSDIMINPIYEGDELNPVVEEEREHTEPLVPAVSGVVGQGVGRIAIDSPEPEQPSELVQKETRPERAFHLSDGSASTCPSDALRAIAVIPAASATAAAPVGNSFCAPATPASGSGSAALLAIPASIEPMAEVSGTSGAGVASISGQHLEPPAQPPMAESAARNEPVEPLAIKASAVATSPEVEINQPAECSSSDPTGEAAVPKPTVEEAIELISAPALPTLPMNVVTSGAPEAASAINVEVPAAAGAAAKAAEVPAVEAPAAGTDAEDVGNVSTSAPAHVVSERDIAFAPSAMEASVLATRDATTTHALSIDSVVDGAISVTADPDSAGHVETDGTPQLPPTVGHSEPRPIGTIVRSIPEVAPGDLVDEVPAALAVENVAPLATEPKAPVDVAAAVVLTEPDAKELAPEVNVAADRAASQLAAADVVSDVNKFIVMDHGVLEAQTGAAKVIEPENESGSEGDVIVAAIVAAALRRAVEAAETAKLSAEAVTFSDIKAISVAASPAPVVLPSTPALDAADRLKSHRVLDTDLYLSEEDELTSPQKTPPLASRTGTANTVEYSPGGDSVVDAARSAAKAEKSLLVDVPGGEAAMVKTIGNATASGADATAGSDAPSSPACTVGEASGGSVDPAKVVTATATAKGKDSLVATTNPVEKSKPKQRGAVPRRAKTGFFSCFACFGGSSAQ